MNIYKLLSDIRKCRKIRDEVCELACFKTIVLCLVVAALLTTISCNKSKTPPIEIACDVNNPLTDLPWLKEYCENLDTQYFSSVNIDLYKVIGTDEHIFYINLIYPPNPDEGPYFGSGFERIWKDCIGKTILTLPFPGIIPPPERLEEIDKFLKSIEYVTELFYFVKQ
jgi:hypothetical protein